jgi:cell division septum initiation protein DivIVA
MILNPWKENRRLREHLAQQVEQTNGRCDAMMSCSDRLDAAEQTLRAISAEAKPTSNATVKRMVRMAQEALKQ